MILSLDVDGFRCFKRLNVKPLGRVNLFIGLNNSGKSSLLEAVNTLVRLGEPAAMKGPMARRRELVANGKDFYGNPVFDLDLRRLFFGHTLEVGSRFELKSNETDSSRLVRFEVAEVYRGPTIDERGNVLPREPTENYLGVEINGEKTDRFTSSNRFKLSRLGGMPADWQHRKALEALERVEFVGTDSTSIEYVAEGWSQIALTPHEEIVDQALRLVAPSFDRLSYVQQSGAIAGTFLAKLNEFPQPVPIGSMGEGIWRMLTIIIALVRAKDGFLLVDEIDTGLHHSIIADVWKIVLSTAEKLNVQVFATTHSLDCIRGLAQICRDDLAEDGSEDRISMHRIERDKPESIHYRERQIVIAAERGIETR